MFSGTPGLYPIDASSNLPAQCTIKNVYQHCQTSSGGQKCLWSKVARVEEKHIIVPFWGILYFKDSICMCMWVYMCICISLLNHISIYLFIYLHTCFLEYKINAQIEPEKNKMWTRNFSWINGMLNTSSLNLYVIKKNWQNYFQSLLLTWFHYFYGNMFYISGFPLKYSFWREKYVCIYIGGDGIFEKKNMFFNSTF